MGVFIGLLIMGVTCYLIFKDINNNKVNKSQPELCESTISLPAEPLARIIQDTKNSEEFRRNISSKSSFIKKYYSSGGTGYSCSNKNEGASISQKELLSDLGLVNIPNKLTMGQASDLIASNLEAKGEYYSDWKTRLTQFITYNTALKFQIDYIILEITIEESLVGWYEYQHSPFQFTQDSNEKLSSYQKNFGIFWGLELNDISIIQAFDAINEALQQAPEYKQKLFKSFIKLENDVSNEYKAINWQSVLCAVSFVIKVFGCPVLLLS